MLFRTVFVSGRARAALLAAALLLPAASAGAGGIQSFGGIQNFRGFTSLRVIQTAHFEIIFPKESEPTAQALASFADAAYERVSGLLGITLKARIPVAVTPHRDQFNSYMNPLPSPHIVLFDTPQDPEWTAFENSLENVFLHELTHAVSLSSRNRPWRVLHSIFGGWVTPALLTAPEFMLEGVSVSFESLDGFGRANDPLIQEQVAQDIHEGAFLTPFQASGVFDLPSQGGYYEYGGLFSAYLQREYGMEKYAALWREMGGNYHFSFVFHHNGFFHAFKKVYGMEFSDAWNAFKKKCAPRGLRENVQGFIRRNFVSLSPASAGIYPAPAVWADKRAFAQFLQRFGKYPETAQIAALDAAGNTLLVLDTFSGSVAAFNTGAGKFRKLAQPGGSPYDLAAKRDGGFFVSSYTRRGSFSGVMNLTRALVTEYDSGGRATGRSWENLYRGRYFRSGVLGILSEGHRGHIVYAADNGSAKRNLKAAGEKPEILLRGTEELLYTNPYPLNERWFCFTAMKKGVRKLCFFDYDTKSAFTVQSDLQDDEEVWRYMRGLKAQGGQILFSYSKDGGMYRLASVDAAALLEAGAVLPALKAVFTEEEFSGGVFLPTVAGRNIYYKGAFSAGDALMKYPADNITGREAVLRLVLWDAEDQRDAGLLEMEPERETRPAPVVPASAPVFIIPAPEMMLPEETPAGPEIPPPVPAPEASVAQTALPAQEAGEEAAPEAVPDTGFLSKPYLPFKYFNPLKLWIPLPVMHPDAGGGSSLAGGSVYTFMTDPVERNWIFLNAGVDAKAPMAIVDFQWTNYSTGVPLSLSVSDMLEDSGLRGTRVSLTAAVAGSDWGSLTAGGGVSFIALDDGEGGSPYTWDYNAPSFNLLVGGAASSIRRAAWQPFGRGFASEGFLRYGFGGEAGGEALPVMELPRVEILLSAAFEPLPLRLRFYGIIDPDGMNLHGYSVRFSPLAPAGMLLQEYESGGYSRATWITSGEAAVKLFTLEAQRGFSHFYFKRLFGTLAYRALLYHDGAVTAPQGTEIADGYRLAQSLMFRLSAPVSTVLITALPLTFTPACWAALKLSTLSNGFDPLTEDLAFGLGVTLSY